MVPPETPGTTFAAPIQNPLIARIRYFERFCDDIYYSFVAVQGFKGFPMKSGFKVHRKSEQLFREF